MIKFLIRELDQIDEEQVVLNYNSCRQGQSESVTHFRGTFFHQLSALRVFQDLSEHQVRDSFFEKLSSANKKLLKMQVLSMPNRPWGLEDIFETVKVSEELRGVAHKNYVVHLSHTGKKPKYKRRQQVNKSSVKCRFCKKKNGHTEDKCWTKNPSLKPGNSSNAGASGPSGAGPPKHIHPLLWRSMERRSTVNYHAS